MAVDIRCALPQELVGGGRGLPCSRKRVLTKQDLLPEIYGAKLPPPQPLTTDAKNLDQTAFTGTQNLPVNLARARSLGALQRGTAVDKALCARHQTNLEILVEVLMQAARPDRPLNIRHFKQPYNPHRDDFVKSRDYTSEQLRSKVLHVLKKYPLADIYDLLQCDAHYWSCISRELGGISHGNATKAALEHVQKTMVSSDRAAFWASVGNRIRCIDHGRIFNIAGSSRALTGDNAEPGLRVTHPQKGHGVLVGWVHKDQTFGQFDDWRDPNQTMGTSFPNGLCRVRFDRGDPHGTDVDMAVIKVKEG